MDDKDRLTSDIETLQNEIIEIEGTDTENEGSQIEGVDAENEWVASEN